MLKHMKCFVWVFVLLIVFPVGLTAQQFVYTNNDLATGNTVSVFAVDTNGSLGPIASYPTGGLGTGGGLYSPNRIVVVKGSATDFLYASNAGSNTVSAFTIDSATGVLTPVGSPVSTGGFNNGSSSGISLAATPDGKYLYVGSTGFSGQFFGSITIFSIDPSTGVLFPVGNPPVVVNPGGPVSSLKVSSNGKFLAAAIYGSSYNEVAMFAIQSGGTLLPVTNSPFAPKPGTGYIASIDINCASNLLFAGRTGSTTAAGSSIDVFNIASDGQLTELANSPFATSTSSNQVVALSTGDSTLFSSNQGDNTVTAFPVGSDGSLDVLHAISVNAAGTAGSTTLPGGLAVSQDGGFLFAADTYAAISTFGVGGSTPLSFDSYTAGLTSGLHSLAAYPAKSCSSSTSSSSLTASLRITAGPPPGFDLEATLALDSSLVVDPLTQPVTITVGTLTINLPAGSFKTFQSGTNTGSDVFLGSIDGTTLKIQITPLGQNHFQISDYAKQIDLTSLTNPVTVMVSIGGNSASASVDATDPAGIHWNR